MKILGAILAGGQSRRFGSDKALAIVQGKTLFDHVADALRPSCAQLVAAGREWPAMQGVADRPVAGLGPLGGLAGALYYAKNNGYDCVLSCGCDIVGLPLDLVQQLGNGPMHIGRFAHHRPMAFVSCIYARSMARRRSAQPFSVPLCGSYRRTARGNTHRPHQRKQSQRFGLSAIAASLPLAGCSSIAMA